MINNSGMIPSIVSSIWWPSSSNSTNMIQYVYIYLYIYIHIRIHIIMSYIISEYYIILYYIILYYITLYYVILCYIMLYIYIHISLCYCITIIYNLQAIIYSTDHHPPDSLETSEDFQPAASAPPSRPRAPARPGAGGGGEEPAALYGGDEAGWTLEMEVFHAKNGEAVWDFRWFHHQNWWFQMILLMISPEFRWLNS